MPSPHLFNLKAQKPQQLNTNGTRTDATNQNVPVLKGLALSLLQIDSHALREPHWHPNAHELGYCLEGRAMMTIFSPGSNHDTFIIEPGTLSFVPMGALHHIENIGPNPLKMLLCFNHENPEDINLSSAVGVMPNHILGDTFSLPATFFANLPKSPDPIFICPIQNPDQTQISWTTNRYKFAVDATHPQVQTKGGWVKMSNGFLMPVLEELSMYSVFLEKKGAREPHWHPNAHELNYLVSGQARITLFSPNGDIDTFDMQPGDMSYLPRGYLHYIENIGSDLARFAIFFNHTFPSDIGLSGCLGAYSNEVLASIFKVPVSYFDALPKYQSDLFVVGGG